jgi:hypothetical protein
MLVYWYLSFKSLQAATASSPIHTDLVMIWVTLLATFARKDESFPPNNASMRIANMIMLMGLGCGVALILRCSEAVLLLCS